MTGYRTPNHAESLFRKGHFRYDPERDVYVCPNQQLLIYRTTNREGYRQYHSDGRQCRECTRSRNATKIVTCHVRQESKDRVDQHRLEPKGKHIYKRRKETVERSFADAIRLPGHRYARMRGLSNVREQSPLAAVAQSIMKIALPLSRPGPEMPHSTRKRLLAAYIRLLRLAITLSATR